MTDIAYAASRKILGDLGFAALADRHEVTITGADPVAPGPHRLGAAAAGVLAAQGALISEIWRERTGRSQQATVDAGRAVVPGLRTIWHLTQNGHGLFVFPRRSDMTNFFRTRDGRRIYLLRTYVQPEVLLRLLSVLRCAPETEAMAKAVTGWDALELEEALAEAKAMGVLARTRQEWLDHPQGQWLAARPPVEVLKIADSAPEPLSRAPARPLEGLRVLDMGHVLSGPVVARVLAEQGAEVLHVAPPYRDDVVEMILDTGWGKRSAFVDLERPGDAERLAEVAAQGDVFIQSWRPGALDPHGMDAATLAARRPGLIYVSVSCFGDGGPWRRRGGYEPISQAVCGLAVENGPPDAPKLSAVGTVADYLSAYLAAAGVQAALLRRAREGGSYHVRVSLAGAAMYVQSLGLLTPSEQAGAPEAVGLPPANYFQETDTVFGRLRTAAPIVQYSETPGYWSQPPQPLGRDPLAWAPA